MKAGGGKSVGEKGRGGKSRSPSPAGMCMPPHCAVGVEHWGLAAHTSAKWQARDLGRGEQEGGRETLGSREGEGRGGRAVDTPSHPGDLLPPAYRRCQVESAAQLDASRATEGFVHPT